MHFVKLPYCKQHICILEECFVFSNRIYGVTCKK